MSYNTTIAFRILWQWWKCIDRYTVFLLCVLSALSLMLVTTSGVAVANRIGVHQSYFSSKHVLYVTLAIFTTFSVSFLSKTYVRRIAICGLIFSIILLIIIQFCASPTKGAKRWINIGVLSLQPSEFMKPCFLVVTGWLLASIPKIEVGFFITFLLYLLVAILLIMQPDLGMLITISIAFGAQLFVACIPWLWLIILGTLTTVSTIVVYYVFPHAQQRISMFFSPNNNGNYQVLKSLQAFRNGGLYGRGPGEGLIKYMLPDSHTDFIFAVAGEEFGGIVCLIILTMFGFIIIYGFIKLLTEEDYCTILISVGILTQLGFQSIVNMGVSLNLLPTKGMTLPFISYGGSSSLAIGLGMGILLALNRRRAYLKKYKLKYVEL